MDIKQFFYEFPAKIWFMNEIYILIKRNFENGSAYIICIISTNTAHEQ